MSLIEFLKDWIINHAKSKDVFSKTIVEIKKDVSEIVIIHKHKEEKYFLDPFLEKIDSDVKTLKDDSHAFVVCMNTIENLKKIIALWKELITYRHLGVVFLNPFSKTEKTWTIFPYTHSMVADDATLKSGLQTMFGQVEPVERANIEKMYENV